MSNPNIVHADGTRHSITDAWSCPQCNPKDQP